MEGFTFSELEQALKDWSEENSENPNEYAENIPRLVQLAELRVVRDLNLDITDAIDVSAAVNAGSRVVIKPAGIIVNRVMWLITAGVRTRLTQRSYDWLVNYAPNPASTGTPKYYAEVDELSWQIAPTPALNATVETRGVYRPESLVDEETTWLGDNVGDLIFAAALMESEDFLKADDRVADYANKYNSLLPTARLEMRNLIRAGDYQPLRPVAQAG